MPFIKRNFPLIKVCGIQNITDAATALDNGANAVGLLIGLTHKADDKITEEEGVTIANFVRNHYPAARIVLVTHLLDPDKVVDIANKLGATSIQIHDDMTVENVKKVRLAMPDVELFKAIHIEGSGQDATRAVIEKAKRYPPYVDGLITDSKSTDPDGQLRIGGTGKRHDPMIGKSLIAAFPNMPVILAGGLTAENVADAIADIKPAGIDANSGLEKTDGSKDAKKVARFAAAGSTIKPFRTKQL